MLVLLPPSEGKTAPTDGPQFDLRQVTPFKDALAEARAEVLGALGIISGMPNALELLGVGPSLSAEVVANTQLQTAPCAPAYQVYSGVLYESGQLAERGTSYQPTANFAIWVQSALFGLVDLRAPIPAYRLSMDTKLGELGALANYWKPRLSKLVEETRPRVIVDCRSGSYIKAWPALETATSEHVLLRVNVVRERAGKRSVVSHNAKKFRGVLAGALLENATQGTLADSLDGVLEVAETLIGTADVTGVETKPAKGFTELIIVTN